MRISQASRWFLERRGIVDTLRAPVPRAALGLHLVHTTPMAPPMPAPVLIMKSQGDVIPDRGVTKYWPHGVDSELGSS